MPRFDTEEQNKVCVQGGEGSSTASLICPANHCVARYPTLDTRQWLPRYHAYAWFTACTIVAVEIASGQYGGVYYNGYSFCGLLPYNLTNPYVVVEFVFSTFQVSSRRNLSAFKHSTPVRVRAHIFTRPQDDAEICVNTDLRLYTCVQTRSVTCTDRDTHAFPHTRDQTDKRHTRLPLCDAICHCLHARVRTAQTQLPC